MKTTEGVSDLLIWSVDRPMDGGDGFFFVSSARVKQRWGGAMAAG
jgi:hypothetical protein